MLIALLAIARKFIILDLGETEPAKIAALAGAALALGAVHWLVRDQDRREEPGAKMPKAINEPKRFRSTCFINLCRLSRIDAYETKQA